MTPHLFWAVFDLFWAIIAGKASKTDQNAVLGKSSQDRAVLAVNRAGRLSVLPSSPGNHVLFQQLKHVLALSRQGTGA